MSQRTLILAATTATATALAALTGAAAQAAPHVTSTPAAAAVGAASADFVGAQGTYQQVTPTRILDTRYGNGAPKARVGAGQEISVLVAGRAGVPQGITAAVVNLTAVDTTASTYLTAYASGTTRPTTSSLNVVARNTRANLVTVPVGADGRIRIFNSSGSTDILADVLGAYNGLATPSTGIGSQYFNSDPQRFYDSRTDGGAYVPGEYVWVNADWGSDINSKVTAYAANITVLQGTASGYVAAGPNASPSTSTVNYGRNQTIANMSVVPSSMIEGFPGFYVINRGPGSVQIIIDVVGLYTKGEDSGLRFRAVPPRRIIDTRYGVGGYGTPVPADTSRQYTAPSSVAGVDTFALVANTTIVKPTLSTWVTTYSNDLPKPGVSNLNAAAGETAANSTFVGLGASNLFRVHNAKGSAPILMDVMGTFEAYPATPPAAPATGSSQARDAATRTPSLNPSRVQSSRG
ncbi:hypothetical protein Q9R29_17270 [Rothia sp. ARF10]|nr:hypothetical protein [Rothia sp. ARF10]